MKKIIIVGALALTSTLSMAQSTATGNMDISANATSGCRMSAEDFSFGNIKYNVAQSLVKNVTIQCSKGTVVELTQVGRGSGVGGFSAAGSFLNFMTLNGQGTVSDTTWVGYMVKVDGIQTNSDYTVTKMPTNNRLGVRSYQTGSYYLGLTMTSGNEVNLPITASVMPSDYTKEAGNYADTITYTLSY